jgi:hypothetical protein
VTTNDPGPARYGKARLGAAGRGRQEICTTPQQAFEAGWRDGEHDPPLTEEQCTRLAALLAPYIRPAQQAA